MDLLQMRYVTAIAQIGNMTKAAETLHVSQSALSLSCKRLEDELGVKLFVRHGRYLKLTRDGTVFCEKAREILALSDELEATLRKQSGMGEDPVVFGTEAIDFSNEMITLYRMCGQNQTLLADNTTRFGIVEKLLQGEYSFVLTLSDLTGEAVESTLLLDEPMLALVGPTSPLNQYKCLEMRQLNGIPLVTTSEEYSIGVLMRSYFQQSGCRPGQIQQVGDSDSIVVKVYNNFGVSFVPEAVVNLWMRNPEICIPGIRWLPLKDEFCRRRIYLTRTKRASGGDCETLLRFVSGYSAAVRKARVYPTLDEVLANL